MLNRIKAAATTMCASPHIWHTQEKDVMASTFEPQGRRSARTRMVSGVLGAGLLGLLLCAPVSWAQLGGGNPPQPPTPPQSTELVFAASIITPENGEVVAQDCFRLNTETGAFRADVISAQGLPDGYWNAVSGQDQSTALFTAYMSALATTDDGQTVPVTISFGGTIGQNGGAGAVVISDGTPLAYQVQMDPHCAVSTAPNTGVRASGMSSGQSGPVFYGN